MPDSQKNPILEVIDAGLDAAEKLIEAKFKAGPKSVALWLLAELRRHLGVPDNYAGDKD